jgi:hypothetical protein
MKPTGKSWNDADIRALKALATVELEHHNITGESIANLQQIAVDLVQELKTYDDAQPDELRRYTDDEIHAHIRFIDSFQHRNGRGMELHVEKLIAMINQLQQERWTA